MSATTVRRWAERLGARWRRGRLVAKGDPERRAVLARLARALLAAYLDALGRRWRLVVVFEDEADRALLPHAGYGWQLVDQPAAIPTPDQNEKVTLFGSLSLEGELVITEAPRKTARGLTEHLEHVAARFSDAVLVVIWDNVGIHHAKATTAWLSAHPEVDPLPCRAPAPMTTPRSGSGAVCGPSSARNRALVHLGGQTGRGSRLPGHPHARAAPGPPAGRGGAPAYTGS